VSVFKKIFALILLLNFNAYADDLPTAHARDLLILSQWFEGEFDNEEQVWFQSDDRSNTPLNLRKTRLHVSNLKISIPLLGENIFLIKEYLENNPDNVLSKSIATIFIDENINQIVMKKARFNPLEPDDLIILNFKSFQNKNVCEIHWKVIASQFHGLVINDSCQHEEKRFLKNYFKKIIISEDKLWIYKRPPNKSDKGVIPIKLRKSKVFLCEASIISSKHNYKLIENKRVLSQGGEVWFNHPENSKKFGIRIRDKEYPFYNIRPDFIFLAIREYGKDFSIGYSIHDVNSRRIGINLGWISAHCHREGYNFREAFPSKF